MTAPGSTRAPEPIFARLIALRAQLGGTYVFDRTALDQRLSELRRRLQHVPVRLAFPVKTAPISAVLEVFSRHGFVLDVSNGGELELASPLNTELWLNGPASSVSPEVLTDRITSILSSPLQVRAACAAPRRQLGLRLNAGFLLSTRTEPSHFGLELEEAKGAAAALHYRGARIRILHAHGNAQLDRQGYDDLVKNILEFRAHHAPEATIVDIGGGQFQHFHEVPRMVELITGLALHLPSGVELGVESGGAHFADGIYFVAPVTEIIERSTRYDLVLGACLSAALQWSNGNIGLVSGSAATGKPVKIVGASCDEADHRGMLAGVAWDGTTAKPRVGSAVVFSRVSPYAIGRSFGFNGIPRPGLMVLD